MKRKLVYIPILLLLLALTAGCSMMGMNDENGSAPSAAPYITEPDMGDGYVRDNDGFIDEDDSGANRDTGISSRIGDDMGSLGNESQNGNGMRDDRSMANDESINGSDAQQNGATPRPENGALTKR